MYPPRTIEHGALVSDSGPLDPLTVAKKVSMRPEFHDQWSVVARFETREGMLAILAVRGPQLLGLMFCIDRGMMRECIRMRPDGVKIATIVGSRIGPPISDEHVFTHSAPLTPSTVPAQMLDLVERLDPEPKRELTYVDVDTHDLGSAIGLLPLDDTLGFSVPTIQLDDEEVG